MVTYSSEELGVNFPVEKDFSFVVDSIEWIVAQQENTSIMNIINYSKFWKYDP